MSIEIEVRCNGSVFYDWLVWDGDHVAAMSLLPRLTRASARRAAERTANRYLARKAREPIRESYRYDGEASA